MPKRPKPPTPDGLSLHRILRHFSTDDAARAYLQAVRWPNGPVCAHCGSKGKVYSIAPNPERKVRPGLFQCGECKGQFTVTVGTIFEDSKVPLRKWLVAWYLLCLSKKGYSALQLQRALGFGSYRTAWFIFHRIRYALRDAAFAAELNSMEEADETWNVGKRRSACEGYIKNKTRVMALVERRGCVRPAGEQKVDFVPSLMTNTNADCLAPRRRFTLEGANLRRPKTAKLG